MKTDATEIDVNLSATHIAALPGWAVEHHFGDLSLADEHRDEIVAHPLSIVWFLDSWTVDNHTDLVAGASCGGIVVLRLDTLSVGVAAHRQPPTFTTGPIHWGTPTEDGAIHLPGGRSPIRLRIPALQDRMFSVIRLSAYPVEPPGALPKLGPARGEDEAVLDAAKKAHLTCMAAAVAVAELYRTSASGSELRRELFKLTVPLGRLTGLTARAANKNSIAATQREIDALFSAGEPASDLPALKGGSRQVAFATDIRSKQIDAVHRLTGIVADAQLQTLRGELGRVDQAGFWIAQRNCTAYQTLSAFVAGSHRNYHATRGASTFTSYDDGESDMTD